MMVMRCAAVRSERIVRWIGESQQTWVHRRLGALLIVAVLAGCATTPWPRTPRHLTQEQLVEDGKKTAATDLDGNPTPTPSIMTVTDARFMVDELDRRLQKAANSRRATELAFDDVTFFGTLTAVGGVAGKSIAARNIGAGIAGLASAIYGHYNPKAQRVAFMQAWSQTRCLRSALNGIDPTIYATFPPGSNGKVLGQVGGQDGTKQVDADAAYSSIPQITYDRVGDIVFQLINSLNDIQTSGASLSDIRTVATAVSDAAKTAAKAPASTPAPSNQSQLESAQVAVQKAGTALSKAKPSNERESQATVQRLKGTLKAAQADLQKQQQIANDEIALKTAFLSAVVQYEASAQACVKLTAGQ